MLSRTAWLSHSAGSSWPPANDGGRALSYDRPRTCARPGLAERNVRGSELGAKLGDADAYVVEVDGTDGAYVG